MRRAGRIDANQNVIVADLRTLPGISVAITSGLGHGFPDLVVGFKARNLMIELKDPAKAKSARKLTPDEVTFHDKWNGQICVCETTDEILALIEIAPKSKDDI